MMKILIFKAQLIFENKMNFHQNQFLLLLQDKLISKLRDVSVIHRDSRSIFQLIANSKDGYVCVCVRMSVCVYVYLAWHSLVLMIHVLYFLNFDLCLHVYFGFSGFFVPGSIIECYFTYMQLPFVFAYPIPILNPNRFPVAPDTFCRFSLLFFLHLSYYI